MSQQPALDIDHIAVLARLALTPEEKAAFQKQLGDVLGYIEKLRSADVTGVDPTAHAFPLFNVLADDVAKPGLTPEALTRNAPASRDNMIVVPKVVDGE